MLWRRGIRLPWRFRQSVSLFCTGTENSSGAAIPQNLEGNEAAADGRNNCSSRRKALQDISVNPGIADKPIASPAVARFKRMSISDEARELLEILGCGGQQDWDQKLSEYYGRITIDIVVDVLNHITDVAAAVHFFKWCNGRQGFVHTSFTFNRLVEFLVNNRHWKLAHQLLMSDKPFPFQANSFTYATIARGYCDEGDTKQALALLQHMKKANITANPKVYNIVLTHLCKLGKEKEALELLHSMTSSSCEPDVVTYNILINSLCKVGRMEDAQGLVDMMQEKGCPIDIVTFNTLIHGLCRKGSGRSRVERALQLFGDMIGKGYVPTAVSYTVVIDALLRVKLDDEAQRLLVEMREAGCVFDIVTYNMLINRFAKAGIMAKAEALFREMSVRGCIPDVVSYNSIIDGFCKAGQIDEADKLFKEMMEKGLSPNGRTYTSITDACLKAGRMQEAHDYLIEMREKDLADAISYIAIISTICKLGKGKLAFQLLKEMIEKGYKPNLITFNAVLEALSSDSDTDEAKALIVELKQFGGKIENPVPSPRNQFSRKIHTTTSH